MFINYFRTKSHILWLSISRIWHLIQFSLCRHHSRSHCIKIRASAVGWGTALQAGRSRVWFPIVSFKISIYLILPAPIFSWVRLSIWHKCAPGIFPGRVKAAVAYSWQTYYRRVSIVLKYRSLNLLHLVPGLRMSGSVPLIHHVPLWRLHLSLNSLPIKRQISPNTSLGWPRGFQKVKVPKSSDNGTGWW